MTRPPAAAPLTFTLDLERHRPDDPRRYADNAARILDFFAARGVRMTVFVVGELVGELAALIRHAHADGHEFALHSYTHVPLTAEDPAFYGARLAACRMQLEDLTGARVHGFRAPVFSLTPAATWVTGLLAEQGFSYSSSVLPAPHPLYGYPQAPMTPFRWPSGLLELPVPLLRLGPLHLPFLGGIYLRYLPHALIARARRALAPEVAAWSYVHPYDIDSDEGYVRFPGAGAALSVLLWRRRAVTFKRLAGLLDASDGQAAPPFAKRLAQSGIVDAASFAPTPAGAAMPIQ